jgi:glycosyltransferase involved in cell wall biosynthesis
MPPEEIIVVDAESTDDTLERVRHFKDAVRLIQQPKAGISAGRNEGIRSARHDWIAFLDGDDEWLPDYLENQRGLLARNPHLVWSGTNYYIRQYETGKRAPAVDPRRARDYLKNKDFVPDYLEIPRKSICSQTDGFIIRKSVLEEIGMFDTSLVIAEDVDLFFRIAYRYPEFGYLPDPHTVYHNRRPGSTTQQYKHEDHYLQMAERQMRFAAQYNREEAFRPIAAKIIRGWLRAAVKDQRIFDVRATLTKYHRLLSVSDQARLYLLTLLPRLTLGYFTLKAQWKNRARRDKGCKI